MKETTTRKIVNNFIAKKALREEKAIKFEDIKIDIKENEKNYIIKSLIDSGYLLKTDNDRLWFNQKLWNATIKKLTIQYSFIIAIPMIIAFVLYMIFF